MRETRRTALIKLYIHLDASTLPNMPILICVHIFCPHATSKIGSPGVVNHGTEKFYYPFFTMPT